MNKLKIIGLLLCVVIRGVSQDFRYTLRNYTAVDGLPQSQVTGLFEDKNGYLWMGTQGGGLARFDGREFKVYNALDGLISSEIWGLLIDNKDRLWILQSSGISQFDGLNFKSFGPTKTRSFKRIFAQQDTIFLISMEGKLARIYNDSLYAETNIVPERRITRFLLTKENEAVYVLDDGTIVIQSNNLKRHIKPQTPIGKVYGLSVYKDQILVQSETGLFSIDKSRQKIAAFNIGFNLTNIIYLYDESRDIFWTRYGSNLIKEYNRNGQVFRDTILNEISINQVFLDSENNTWFASNGYGLYKYYVQDFDKITAERIQGVMGIEVDRDKNIWAGTMTRGLWRIKDGKSKNYSNESTELMPSRNSVNSLDLDQNGKLWVATKGGLAYYDKSKDDLVWIEGEDGATNYFTRCVKIDEEGGLWAVTEYGLGHYKNGKWQKFYSSKDGLKDMYPMALFYSKKYHSLILGNESNIQGINNDKIVTYDLKGVHNSYVISISDYRDSMIVAGTGGAGLVLFNPVTLKTKYITTKEGLASDFVYFVTSDEKGYLWVGTEKGINRLKLGTTYDIIENLHYGYENGLIGVETNQNASYISQKEKYFGLVDGLYEFTDLPRLAKKSFDLHLTDVKILYGEYSAREYAESVESFFKIPQGLALPTDKNHVTFTFNKVDKQHPKSVKFKYFLENFDKAWSQPTTSGEATYGNLPPGDYVFRVMATDSNGSWGTTRLAYPFNVKSPFYMQASFIIGFIIALSGLVTLILYARVKQRINKAILMERIRTQEQESLRKEIARDFHDEMGNQLTRIINYVSLLKLNGQSGFNHDELYNKVESSAKYLYTGTRDFIWSIDPVNDELSRLFIHIRDFGEKLFEEKNMQFRAINDIKEKVKLPYGFSREANLIFKEAMTNAFKYSTATNVTLSLSYAEGTFQMALEDDGIGFNVGGLENSNGLKNIRERADKLGGILRISSQPNNGTKITLSFKLNKTLKYGLTV